MSILPSHADDAACARSAIAPIVILSKKIALIFATLLFISAFGVRPSHADSIAHAEYELTQGHSSGSQSHSFSTLIYLGLVVTNHQLAAAENPTLSEASSAQALLPLVQINTTDAATRLRAMSELGGGVEDANSKGVIGSQAGTGYTADLHEPRPNDEDSRLGTRNDERSEYDGEHDRDRDSNHSRIYNTDKHDRDHGDDDDRDIDHHDGDVGGSDHIHEVPEPANFALVAIGLGILVYFPNNKNRRFPPSANT